MTNLVNAADFVFDIDGFKGEVKPADSSNSVFDVTLTRDSVKVEVALPGTMRYYVNEDRIIVKTKSKSYKGTKFTIPIADNDGQFSLFLTDSRGNYLPCEFERKPKGEDVELVPKVALLQNGTNETLKMNANNSSFEVFANNTILIPFDFEIALPSDKYTVDVLTDSFGVKKTTITKKGEPVSGTNSPTSGGYQGGYSSGNPNASKKYYGIYWYEGRECKLVEDQTQSHGHGVFTTWIEGRPCTLCFDEGKRPMADALKKHEKENKKNGFIVNVNNGRCTIVSTIKPKDPVGKPNNGPTGGDGGNGGKRKKRWILIAILAVVLLGAGLGLGLGFGLKGKSKKPVYTIKLAMTHDTKLDHVNVSLMGTGRQDKTFEQVDNNTILLKKDWIGVDIIIQTQNEGKCMTITVDSAKTVTPRSAINNPTFFTVARDEENKMMTLTITSPAWEKIEKVDVDQDDAIQRYARIAEEYNNSDQIAKTCIDKARALVDETNPEAINIFIESFKSVLQAKSDIGELNAIMDDLINSAKAEKENEARKENIDNFKSCFNLVRSTQCTSKAIKNLQKCYNIVKGDPELLDIIHKLTGSENVKTDAWVEDSFIKNQQAVINIFSAKKGDAESTLERFTNGNYNDTFHPNQINAMKMMLKNFDDNWNDRPLDNTTLYQYISNQK